MLLDITINNYIPVLFWKKQNVIWYWSVKLFGCTLSSHLNLYFPYMSIRAWEGIGDHGHRPIIARKGTVFQENFISNLINVWFSPITPFLQDGKVLLLPVDTELFARAWTFFPLTFIKVFLWEIECRNYIEILNPVFWVSRMLRISKNGISGSKETGTSGLALIIADHPTYTSQPSKYIELCA